MKTKSNTAGEWNVACDSYGKVQHSRKYDCVYTVVKGEGGERLVNVAARIGNPADARLISVSKELLAELKTLGAFIEKHKAALIGVECTGEEYEANVKPSFAIIRKAEGRE